MEASNKILVLGIGNILLRDEGVGVFGLLWLEKNWKFSHNVTLLDGGTLGMKLVEPIGEADHLVVLDTVQIGLSPGTVTRLSYEDLKIRIAGKNSLHQVNFSETLAYAEMLDMLPKKISIVGIEAENMTPWAVELTPRVRESFPQFCRTALDEIEKAGGTFQSRKTEISLDTILEDVVRTSRIE